LALQVSSSKPNQLVSSSKPNLSPLLICSTCQHCQPRDSAFLPCLQVCSTAMAGMIGLRQPGCWLLPLLLLSLMGNSANSAEATYLPHVGDRRLPAMPPPTVGSTAAPGECVNMKALLWLSLLLLLLLP
jgi:hypothetical protein